MTNQVISRSSLWLMPVDPQTNGTYWHASIKVCTETVVNITRCVLSALEFLCRIALFIPSAVMTLWTKDTLSHVVQRIGSAGQNTVQSLAAICRVKAAKVKTESAWSGKVRAFKRILSTPYFTLYKSYLTFAATHKSTVQLAKHAIVAMTVGYAAYHFPAIKAKVFSSFGLDIPTPSTLVAQLFSAAYAGNWERLDHTFKKISLHYPLISIGCSVSMGLLGAAVCAVFLSQTILPCCERVNQCCCERVNQCCCERVNQFWDGRLDEMSVYWDACSEPLKRYWNPSWCPSVSVCWSRCWSRCWNMCKNTSLGKCMSAWVKCVGTCVSVSKCFAFLLRRRDACPKTWPCRFVFPNGFEKSQVVQSQIPNIIGFSVQQLKMHELCARGKEKGQDVSYTVGYMAYPVAWYGQKTIKLDECFFQLRKLKFTGMTSKLNDQEVFKGLEALFFTCKDTNGQNVEGKLILSRETNTLFLITVTNSQDDEQKERAFQSFKVREPALN